MNEKLLFLRMIPEACQRARLALITSIAARKVSYSASQKVSYIGFHDLLANSALTNFYELAKKMLEKGIESLIYHAEGSGSWTNPEIKALVELLGSLALFVEREKTLRGED